ncbi:hypothetical protein BH20ACT9_BH20ACT9_04450 [soil metagenome]
MPDEDGSGGGGAQEKLEPGTTAIFHGGPATGPWQQIGSVAEITHPRADPTARRAYDRYWVAYGLPNELWDELAAGVSLKLVKLGRPANRPTFDGAPGSEPFNASAGIDLTNQQTGNRGILVSFMGTHIRAKSAVQVNFPFLIDPSTYHILAAKGQVDFSERRFNRRAAVTDRYFAVVESWLKRQPRL